MKNIIRTMLLLMFGLALQSHAYLHQDGQNIVDSTGAPYMLRGYGLGGWLVPEGYMLHMPGFGSPRDIYHKVEGLVGTENADQFFELYRTNYVKEEDIDLIAEWGFNSIRLPFHYVNFYDTTLQQMDEYGFDLVDTLLVWCKNNDLYLILDMHCAPGGQSVGPISDSDPYEARFWTEPENQELAIYIWKQIAERYANEPQIGGYDLLNESVTPDGYGGEDLRNFFVACTDTIRTVDTNHIVFIEGNYYATTFDNLYPPFDDNMAYSFHKYWNATDQGTINYLISIRSQYDTPLWLGETGENSNPWFYETKELMEENNIGWCWWAHKKLETITSPLSSPIETGFQTLLDYWNGQGSQPPQAYAIAALNEMAENLLIENCDYRPGVILSLMDPDFNLHAIPYKELNIPGIVNAVEYDLGNNGVGYVDTDYMNTGNSSWNSGYQLRNDGVDIEESSDPEGYEYNVGWIDTGEYLIYTVNVQYEGDYVVTYRVASDVGGGRIHMYVDNSPVGGMVNVDDTGGWQNWISVYSDTIFLTAGTHKITVQAVAGGFNFNRMTFEYTSELPDDDNQPHSFKLEQNYPNPFNPKTTIEFYLKQSGKVSLKIYNLLGEKVRTLISENMIAGLKSKIWDATNDQGISVPTGIYIYKLKSPEGELQKKMLFLK